MLISLETKGCLNPAMDNQQIRRANLQELLDIEALEGKGASRRLAEKGGTAPAYISQILSAKTKANVGNDLARRLEVAYKKGRGWMDANHGSAFAAAEGGAPLPPPWPFKFDKTRYDRLSATQKRQLELMVLGQIAEWESQAPEVRKAG